MRSMWWVILMPELKGGVKSAQHRLAGWLVTDLTGGWIVKLII